MIAKYASLFAITLLIDNVDAFSLDPSKNENPIKNSGLELSRRELFTIPIGIGGAVFYGKLLSDATEKFTRGDLAYPDSHERRAKTTMASAIAASLPQSQSSVERNPNDLGIGRPLRILEVGIGKDCRVIRRGLYKDAFAEVSSRGVSEIQLTGVDIVSPTTTTMERAKDVLRRKKEGDGADVSFEFVEGSLTSRLDFPDGYFDCVLCTLTLCSVEDQITALGEIKRVIRKDGGTFGYVEHVAVNPDEPYRLLELEQLAFDGFQQIVADNCHLHRYTEDSIYSVLGVSDGTSRVLAKERFLVDQMWPVSCQTCGVVQLI